MTCQNFCNIQDVVTLTHWHKKFRCTFTHTLALNSRVCLVIAHQLDMHLANIATDRFHIGFHDVMTGKTFGFFLPENL